MKDFDDNPYIIVASFLGNNLIHMCVYSAASFLGDLSFLFVT